jgi:hypothetical protein
MPANRSGQNDFFQVASLQVIHIVFVGNACDALLDDRAIVGDFRNVVRRGADQLYAMLIGLMVWLAAHKRRQERSTIYRAQFPNETAYIASEWRGRVPLTRRAHCARRNLELHRLDVTEKRRRFSVFGWRPERKRRVCSRLGRWMNFVGNSLVDVEFGVRGST